MIFPAHSRFFRAQFSILYSPSQDLADERRAKVASAYRVVLNFCGSLFFAKGQFFLLILGEIIFAIV